MIKNKMFTFRMCEEDFLKFRKQLGLHQYRTGERLTIGQCLNNLIAAYVSAETKTKAEAD